MFTGSLTGSCDAALADSERGERRSPADGKRSEVTCPCQSTPALLYSAPKPGRGRDIRIRGTCLTFRASSREREPSHTDSTAERAGEWDAGNSPLHKAQWILREAAELQPTGQNWSSPLGPEHGTEPARTTAHNTGPARTTAHNTEPARTTAHNTEPSRTAHNTEPSRTTTRNTDPAERGSRTQTPQNHGPKH